MKKLNLFVVRPSDTREEVQKKFVEYLKLQGIKIVKEKKMKRINIDENNYIELLPNGDFELHCYVQL